MKHKAIGFWIAVSFLTSCTSKGSKENPSQEWREMDTFEVTIEKAFKPLKDSGTVVSVEKMIVQVADEAEKLASSPLPDKMNNDELKKKLEKLKTDTRALANDISIGTEDDVVGTNFYQIHDLYQEIRHAWKK